MKFTVQYAREYRGFLLSQCILIDSILGGGGSAQTGAGGPRSNMTFAIANSFCMRNDIRS
jgi:hypothetical protein